MSGILGRKVGMTTIFDEVGDQIVCVIDDAFLFPQFGAGDVRLNIEQVAARRRPLGLLSRVEELRRGV